MRVFIRNVDAVIALSEASRVEVVEHYGRLSRAASFVIPHGSYRGVYPDTASREQARRSLNLPSRSRVLLFFGQLRPYKRPERLVCLFRRFAGESDRLLIVGEPVVPAVAEAVAQCAGDDARVTLHLQKVRSSDVQIWFRAADVVVLPYERITNSGAAILALSLDCPVLAPAQGSLVELADTCGPAWVAFFDGPFDEVAVRKALGMTLPRGKPDMSTLDWQEIGRDTLEAFRITASRRPSKPRRRGR
ncbi:MAG: glycosyltransferase [Acidimicrobiales bacterium]